MLAQLFLDEAMFSSACFYKYFSVNWETLVCNLKGHGELAAHTIGAFICAAALVNPAGKQNSFAAHNLPDGILVEIRDTPINYANAFAKPVSIDKRDIVSQSIAQLSQYIYDLDEGYYKPEKRFWFSPNLRYTLLAEKDIAKIDIKSLDDLISKVIAGIGYKWEEVQKVIINTEQEEVETV